MVMRQRYLERVDFTASTTQVLDMPNEHWDKEILLLLDGQCDSGSSVSRSTYNPFDIISRIELVANGQQTIKSISGKMLYLQNILEHGAVPARTQTPSSTSQSNQAFGGALTLYFDKDKDFVETLLPSHVLSSLQLKITFATAATIDSGTGFNIDYLYVRPLLTEEINTGQSTAGVGVLKEVEYTKVFTASGWHTLKLPVGNVYNSLSMLFRNNSAPSNTVVEEFEIVKDGLEIIRKVRVDQSRAEDLKEYALESANQPTGYTTVDFDKGGSAPINTAGWSSLEVRFYLPSTPTATSDVTVSTEEVILPR